jgi:phage I-like protein
MLYGKDMRSWSIRDPFAVLRRLEGRTLVLDENHSTYLLAPKGEKAPALARLSNFSLQADGSLWAESVEWTKYGMEVYDGGEYLGLSPVILFDPSTRSDDTALGEVVDIHSMALVNDPNLPMPALNAAEVPKMKPENTETVITPPPAPPAPAPPAQLPDFAAIFAAALAPVVSLLGELKTSIAAIATAPAPQAAPNASQPSQHLQLVSAALEGFVSSGKIANNDAERARFLANCATPEALAREIAHYTSAPALVSLNAANLQVPAPGDKKQFTAEQIAIGKLFGRSPDQIKD